MNGQSPSDERGCPNTQTRTRPSIGDVESAQCTTKTLSSPENCAGPARPWAAVESEAHPGDLLETAVKRTNASTDIEGYEQDDAALGEVR